METLDHFLHIHPHPLKFFEVRPEYYHSVYCRGCRKSVDKSSSCYGCSDCRFYLHRSCAELPREILNFFHPCPLLLDIPYSSISSYYICNACFKEGEGFSYHCEGCQFDMHVECAQRPTIQSDSEELIQHFVHWHPLKLLVDPSNHLDVGCAICEKLCSASDSAAYGCKECNFFVHNSCMISIPRQINHSFHPSCPLILLTSHLSRCKGCDEVGPGCPCLFFRCGKCEFQMDLKCALLPTIESKDANKILHSVHKHPLVLCKSNELDNEVRCRACGESCLAPCFGCQECNFFLHKPCAIGLHGKERQIHHPFHPLHPLILSSPPPLPHPDTFQCSSCLELDDLFLLHYHCAKCDFNLHIDCAKLPKLTVPVGHIHHLTYFDKTFAPVQCSICHEEAQTGFFRCLACAFNIHIYCIPLTPKTITHNRHSHPLTLTKSPFEFELISKKYGDGSDDELFCDVCEKKRYKFESVYYCPDCKYIAEVRCVLSELLPSLMISEEQSRMESTVVSRDGENLPIEATIKNLKSKIAKSKGVRRNLNKKVNLLREKLKRYEGKLEQENRKFRQLKTDHFLYKYQYGYKKKEIESPTDASSSFSGDDLPWWFFEPSSDSSAE